MTRCEVLTQNICEVDADALVVGLFAAPQGDSRESGGQAGNGAAVYTASALEVENSTSGAVSRVLATGDFTGARGEIVVIYGSEGVKARRVILAGLGAIDAFNEEAFAADVLMCAACNTRDYGGGFRAAPNACPWDGWIDLVIVRRVSRAKILRLLGRYKKGGHFSGAELDDRTSDFFIYRRARSISIETADGAGPLVATADGECAPVEKLDISLRPLAGRVILPRAAFERAKAPALSGI